MITKYADFMARRPRVVLAFALILAIVSALYAGFFLETKKGVLDLYSKEDPDFARFIQFSEDFKVTEDLIIIIESKENPSARKLIEDLVIQIKKQVPKQVRHIHYRLKPEFLETNLINFSRVAELEALEQALLQKGILRNWLRAQNMAQVVSAINQELNKNSRVTFSTSSSGSTEKKLQGLNALLAPLDAVATKSDFSVFNNPELKNRFDSQGYFYDEKNQFYLVFVRPVELKQDYSQAQKLVRKIRAIQDELQQKYPGIKIGLSGGPALADDQFSVSERDMSWASLFAILSTMLIFFVAFKSFLRPLMGFVTLCLVLAYTYGLTTLCIGHLNMFSLAFVIILIGQGTYYGVHIVARYEEFLREYTSAQAAKLTLINNFRNIGTSALTTSAAFFSCLLIDLKGFAELGFIAGTGVLIAASAMLFILPALLILIESRVKNKIVASQVTASQGSSENSGLAGSFAAIIQKYRYLVLLPAILILVWLVFLFGSGQSLQFEHNFLKLQAKNTQAVQYEEKLSSSSWNPRPAIFIARDTRSAATVVYQLKLKNLAKRIEWIGDFIFDTEVLAKQKLIKEKILSHTCFDIRCMSQGAGLNLKTELQKLRSTLQKRQSQSLSAYDAEKIVAAFENKISVVNKLLKQDAFQSEAFFNQKWLQPFQKAFFKAARSSTFNFEKLEPYIRETFISDNKSIAVYVYPEINIWDAEAVLAWTAELKKMDLPVTGPPLIFSKIISIVEKQYFKAASLAATIIFVLFLINLRSLLAALLCFLPLVLGVAALAILMIYLDIHLHTANMIALPLILGVGADNGVHIMNRFLEKRNIVEVYSSTAKALLITYLDTLTSFIGIALASHQGLASLGQIIILGITCCTVVGIIILPALLSFKVNGKGK